MSLWKCVWQYKQRIADIYIHIVSPSELLLATTKWDAPTQTTNGAHFWEHRDAAIAIAIDCQHWDARNRHKIKQKADAEQSVDSSLGSW